jgi:16S rRNA (adenine1518-N6/adenine1519-N6)-dimethyltransferase
MKKPSHATSNIPHPKSDLQGKGLRPKNSFGQNFLSDEHHQNTIAHIAALGGSNDSPIVEWGAGLGALTRQLLARTKCVHAVERDRDLVPILASTFANEIKEGRLVLHEANATTFPVEDLIAGSTGAKFKLCGNLPYHLTSSLLFRTLELAPLLDHASFLIQLDVAKRIEAGPGNRTYGLLSVLLQSRFDVDLAHIVPRDAFWPAPKVDGGVIRLIPKASDPLSKEEREYLTTLVKAAFQKRRKTLRNALSGYEGLEAAMGEMGLSSKQRAETIRVEEYIKLAQKLFSIEHG